MRGIKISCFRYRRHIDIYVSNISFSTDALLSMLDLFPEQKIIILIEADEKDIRTISSIMKSIQIAGVVSHFPTPTFSAVCDKPALCCLLNRVNANNFEGMFIANIISSIAPDRLISSLAYSAGSAVKDGISDMSISIIFPENQLDIAFTKGKYEPKSVKDKVRCIFGA